MIERDLDGWINFNKAIEEESDEFERPTGDDEVLADDISLIISHQVQADFLKW